MKRRSNKSERLWLESSFLETILANAIAEQMLCQSKIDSELSQELIDFAELVYEDGLENTLSKLYPSLPYTLLLPSGSRIVPSSPFPVDDQCISSNLFAGIAYLLKNKDRDPSSVGAILTPAILARDMTSLGASILVSDRSDIPLKVVSEHLFSFREHALQGEYSVVTDVIPNLTWYDPCVGGGVFPLSILELLTSFNVPINEALGKIWGNDVDLLSVTATRIRLAAFCLSNGFGSTFKQALSATNNFTVRDTLMFNTEQGLLETTANEEIPTADIVIGNPPYVRSNRMNPVTKSRLQRDYPSVGCGRADLYNYFIANGLNSLSENGVLVFVSPASFQKSEYGRKTRQYISEEGSLVALYDFDELPVFANASLHCSVYAIAKGRPQGRVFFYSFNHLPSDNPLHLGLIQSKLVDSNNFNVKGWTPHFENTGSILDSLSTGNSCPLAHYASNIYSGIKTGYSRAFFISGDEASRLSSDPRVRRFIRPMYIPLGIRPWRPKWDGTHMIYIERGQTVPEDTELYQHLIRNEEKLRARSDIQGHETWYGQRSCNYLSLFQRTKIIFPDIANECRFALDEEGFLIPDGAFMIPDEDYYLLGLLNSCIADFYFRARCNTIGNPQSKGRLRFKKTYVEEFPIPQESIRNRQVISSIADNARKIVEGGQTPEVDSAIDELVLSLYAIPKKHWKDVRKR